MSQLMDQSDWGVLLDVDLHDIPIFAEILYFQQICSAGVTGVPIPFKREDIGPFFVFSSA